MMRVNHHSSGADSIPIVKYIIYALFALFGLVAWFQLWPYAASPPHQYAIAVLRHPQGSSPVEGTIEFLQLKPQGPVSVNGIVRNLDPNSKHGFHIHEMGDLSNGCTSTGAHYNPLGKSHGAPMGSSRHVGDLGNIASNTSGIASVDIQDSLISLNGEFSIIGRAVVVHAGVDDLGRGNNAESLKTGNAGPRVACGVIGLKA